jgi:predicted secreted Zn-dependent protease
MILRKLRWSLIHQESLRNSFLIIVSVFVMTSARAEITDTLDYEYYDVAANPRQRLATLLNNASPIREDGKTFHGHTKWKIRWNFTYQKNKSGECKIETADVVLDAKITLPRLVGDSPEQQKQMERYLVPLKIHEMGHYQIAQQAALAVEQKLASMPGKARCSDLEKAANEAGKETVNAYNEKNRLYDVETDHGKSQGARAIN